MRAVILTAHRHGSASRALPELVKRPEIEVAGVVYCEGHYRSRRAKVERDLRKSWRIGPLGVLTGLYLRRWFRGEPAPDLFPLAESFGVPVATTPRTNARRTRELMAELGAELGLSLGNSYIAPRVFRTPSRGMINVHGEILPRFQGASSVIWAIHEGLEETGFTIHQIDRSIDTGKILYQETMPILFAPTLRETVERTLAAMKARVPVALADVVADYDTYWNGGTVQRGGRSYTTPTFSQFLRMKRMHRAALERRSG